MAPAAIKSENDIFLHTGHGQGHKDIDRAYPNALLSFMMFLYPGF